MRIHSRGSANADFFSRLIDFGRHLHPKPPSLQALPMIPCAPREMPLPPPRSNPGLSCGTVGVTPDGRLVVIAQGMVIAEGVAGDGDFVVTEEGEGHVTIRDARGQTYTFAFAAVPQVSVAGGEIGEQVEPGDPASPDFLPTHRTAAMNPASANSTLLGGAGGDRLLPADDDARLYGARSDLLEAGLRGEIPLWAMQGHSIWQYRQRAMPWWKRRQLLRWRQQLRRVARRRLDGLTGRITPA